MSEADRKPGIAVWGVGEHARKKTLPALAECAAVRLVGLTTRNATVRAEQARKWGCLTWERPEEMLTDTRVDVVYLATPNGTHHDYGLQVLEAGRHLWCEKSLTDALEKSEELVSKARSRDLALSETFVYWHHPQYDQIRDWLDAGQIGRIRSVTARFGFPHRDRDDVRYDAKLGGGALLDIGVYPLSAARYLIGEELEWVAAQLESDVGYEVDTGGSALLRFPSGVDALLEWGFGRSYRNEVELWGTGGTIRAERAFSKPPTLSPALTLSPQEGEKIAAAVEPADHFVRMFTALAAALADGDEREWYRTEALAQARMVAAVRAAARAR